METCGFDNLTRDERDELAQEAAGFLHNQTSEPFLLVTSFINPHDICYVELDATAEYYGLPKLYPNNIIEREKVAEAVQLAENAKAEGSFDSLCPPLKKNHELTENLPDILIPEPFNSDEIQSDNVYSYMGGHVRTVWTEEDWRMHHWIYHRLTEDVDRQIGIVLDALQETGLDQNTIVVFLSDHGDMDGAHKKVHKGDFYEESSRVPFIVAGPGVIQSVDNKHLISSSVDLIPTLCDFAGIEISEGVQGRSIKPLAVGKQPENWRKFVVSENSIGRMVRSDRFKYILYRKGKNREMLFDIIKDPGEMINLALNSDYENILLEHRKLLESWIKETRDPIATEYVF
jgi:arylsulfatase A-like enzyme